MPSTVTTPVTARLPNEQAALLHRLAEQLGITTSKLIAGCVDLTLSKLGGGAHEPEH